MTKEEISNKEEMPEKKELDDDWDWPFWPYEDNEALQPEEIIEMGWTKIHNAMKPFNDLKDLTFYELCAETQRAYEAKEIEWDVLVAIVGQYAVYQDNKKQEI